MQSLIETLNLRLLKISNNCPFFIMKLSCCNPNSLKWFFFSNTYLHQEPNTHRVVCKKFQLIAGRLLPKKMNATFQLPHGVFFSAGELFIADTNNHRVRKVLRNGHIVTICGTGKKGYSGDGQLATTAELSFPTQVFVSFRDEVYIVEDNASRIRKIDRNGIISTIAEIGNELFVTDDDEVLIADKKNNHIWKIDRVPSFWRRNIFKFADIFIHALIR